MDRGVSSPDSVSTNSTTVAVGAEPVSKTGLAAVVIVITTVSRWVESARRATESATSTVSFKLGKGKATDLDHFRLEVSLYARRVLRELGPEYQMASALVAWVVRAHPGRRHQCDQSLASR
jgi:hypothetical protein